THWRLGLRLPRGIPAHVLARRGSGPTRPGRSRLVDAAPAPAQLSSCALEHRPSQPNEQSLLVEKLMRIHPITCTIAVLLAACSSNSPSGPNGSSAGAAGSHTDAGGASSTAGGSALGGSAGVAGVAGAAGGGTFVQPPLVTSTAGAYWVTT